MANREPRSGSGAVLAYPLGQALYLNITSSCTLACTFCPKIRDRDFVIAGFDLKIVEPPTVDEVWSAILREGLSDRSEVVFTGFGEPTRRMDVLLELIRRLKDSKVSRVRLDTDGLANLREKRDVTPDLASAGLDAVSISLNAPDAETYAEICPSHFGLEAWNGVVAFVQRSVKTIPEVAVSCVALPGISEAECRRVVTELGARFRWRPYDRLGRLDATGGAG